MFGWNDNKLHHGMTEESGVGSGQKVQISTGIVSGTKVATQIGWQTVEDIKPGDLVLTFDGGLQPVQSVRVDTFSATGSKVPHHLWPFEVPANGLGNRSDMMLMPEQTVMIESDAAEELFGDAFAVIPAAVLEGFRGTHRVLPTRDLDVITLEFENDEVVFANMGALFLCPKARDIVSDMVTHANASYDVLSMNMADALIDMLQSEDQVDCVPAHSEQSTSAVA